MGSILPKQSKQRTHKGCPTALQGGKKEKKVVGRKGGDGGDAWVASADHCSPATSEMGSEEETQGHEQGLRSEGTEQRPSSIGIEGRKKFQLI